MAVKGTYTTHQRFGIAILIVIGATTLIFGIFSLERNIKLPLFVPDTDFVWKTSEELEQEREEQLKTMDTDSDALTDYDELYIYRTSPFLEDSDSDGINDGVEVASMEDPNCPRGRNCGQSTTTSQPVPVAIPGEIAGIGDITPSVIVTEDLPPEVAQQMPTEEEVMMVITETFGDPAELTPEILAQQIQEMSLEEIHTFLGKLGVPKEILEKTDKETIQLLLQESLMEISTQMPTTQ